MAAFALGLSSLVVGGGTVQATAAPAFQLPFTCGESWRGTTSSSAHGSKWEIDFNRGNSPDADLGSAVLASAAGRVVTSAHQGNSNGFGNLVKIEHAGGLASYYAHLNARFVKAGDTVARGQRIGTVGKTTMASRKGMPAHLHYEVRAKTGTWPNNIKPAVFNGVRFGYPTQTLTSKNCGGGGESKPQPGPKPGGNPYSPERVCGSGYKRIDSAPLGKAATVFLLYNSANGHNCVTTVKNTGTGGKSAVSAYLEVKGKRRTTDSGNFQYYAGPVRAYAKGVCVKWGGSAGATRYNSPFEHCRG
ncbi:M23 family metallopeptidase [Sinosporangium siamense]|nr:M23 family metallopeptidase [Sinosporangium siamense]